MRRKPDHELAWHLLAQRASGYSVLYVLRHSRWRYLLTVVLIVLVAVAVGYIDDPAAKVFAAWALGMLMGALVRDCGWFRHIKANWSFSQKVIDWRKVEELAGRDEPANKPSEHIAEPASSENAQR